LKENIEPLKDSLEKVLRLQGVEYDYKDHQKFTSQNQVGVIAQDVEKVYPEVVTKDPKTGLRAVAYDHLVAPLIEAVKSLHKLLMKVESRQTSQERELASIKAENAQLKAKDQLMDQKIRKLEQNNAAMKSYFCAKDPHAPICE
jgi:hypothetical protein